MFTSIQAIKTANANSSQPFWFDEATMAYFDSKIETEVCHDHFVTSEEGPDGVRAYTVRLADADAHIQTIGTFMEHATLPAAVAAMKSHALDVLVKVPETV